MRVWEWRTRPALAVINLIPTHPTCPTQMKLRHTAQTTQTQTQWKVSSDSDPCITSPNILVSTREYFELSGYATLFIFVGKSMKMKCSGGKNSCFSFFDHDFVFIRYTFFSPMTTNFWPICLFMLGHYLKPNLSSSLCTLYFVTRRDDVAGEQSLWLVNVTRDWPLIGWVIACKV